MTERHLFRVDVLIRSNWRGILFTGKLVKSLIIDAEPRLKRFFEKSSGAAPKLIHVTPLYTEEEVNGRRRVRCVYSCVKNDNGRSRTEVVRTNGKYTFYVGLVESAAVESPRFNEVYNALLNLSGRHLFKNHAFDVELLSVDSVDVERYIKDAVSHLLKAGEVRIIFASPTLLRDPFRSGKHKSLTPTPMNIFSTPVYINLYLTGRLRQKLFIKTLIILHRLLNEPYSIHRTTGVAWVKYDEDKRPIPTLIGYVNLFLNREFYDNYISRGVDVEASMGEALSTLLALGTGTSRSAGFGHANITTPHPAPDVA